MPAVLNKPAFLIEGDLAHCKEMWREIVSGAEILNDAKFTIRITSDAKDATKEVKKGK